jgi:hypothetical protein
MNNLPDELFIHIFSFLDSRYERFVSRGKCICYTLASSVSNKKHNQRKCKIKTRAVFCHIHRNLPLPKLLSCIAVLPPVPKSELESGSTSERPRFLGGLVGI